MHLFETQMAKSLFALTVLAAVAIAGYMLIEGWPFLDAAYMTVLTFTTVGYEEVRPLSSIGRVFTMFIMVVGAGVNGAEKVGHWGGVIVYHCRDDRRQ